MVERKRIGFRRAEKESEEGDKRVSDNLSFGSSVGGVCEGGSCSTVTDTEEHRPKGSVQAQGGEPEHKEDVGIIRYNSKDFVPNKEGGLSPIRKFESGATRDTDVGKLDYVGFFSPLVLKRRAEYMHKHRVQPDGTLRASNNWQNGIPVDEYMKSMSRHFVDVWMEHCGYDSRDGIEEALCGLMFNAEGYLFEILKEKR